jgi:hypothetical protein
MILTKSTSTNDFHLTELPILYFAKVPIRSSASVASINGDKENRINFSINNKEHK